MYVQSFELPAIEKKFALRLTISDESNTIRNFLIRRTDDHAYLTTRKPILDFTPIVKPCVATLELIEETTVQQCCSNSRNNTHHSSIRFNGHFFFRQIQISSNYVFAHFAIAMDPLRRGRDDLLVRDGQFFTADASRMWQASIIS